MKDRVREALFNLLGPRIKGTLAIDLFAGTGALGIEALSRGASQAIFVERHFPSADRIKGNLAALDCQSRGQVFAADVFYWIANQLPAQQLPWTVFVAPPYALFDEQFDRMMQAVAHLIDKAPPGSRLVVESRDNTSLDGLPHASSWLVRTYSPAQVAIFDLDKSGSLSSPTNPDEN
jgi:16S rRNA (guanine(966)-N(2))-methyltransferase RsmD